MARIYLDHAASAPLRSEAAEALARTESLLNPAGQYASGRAASRIVEDARERIADLLGADRAEVIFTGSGTEANTIAVQGLAFGARRTRGARRIHSSLVEHPAVGESVAWLCAGLPVPEEFRFEHVVLSVDAAGRPEVRAELTPEFDAVITAMWANNETGNISDLGTVLGPALKSGVPTHVDAVQAVGHIPVDFHRLGVSTVAASAHKFGGPKSVGLLLARRDAIIDSPLRGGGQERGIRSGTVNPQGAAATAAALAAAVKDMTSEQQRLTAFQNKLMAVVQSIPGAIIHTDAVPSRSGGAAELNGSCSGGALASHVHASFPGAEGDSLIMLLDAAGIDASTGSACSAGVNRASHVLSAMGVDAQTARGTLRLTMGQRTSSADIDRLCVLLPDVVEQARAAGMAYETDSIPSTRSSETV